MKIILGGKIEIEITPTEISAELAAELEKAARLAKLTDSKVEDEDNDQ